ncbi:class I SAM-dependent methyltransferase [Streptomyces sp. Q6]|uniref:Class I SAM-dependent methyltransferase n=1 Tax=Streptomyces citrinus TaxID=3118173 RepID=A0ACD5AK23_9ACTN
MTTDNDRRVESNRTLWNEWAARHGDKAMAATVKRLQPVGSTTLRDFEVEDIGDVAQARLLHLQCMFGADTISWSRQGARATGLDFSEEAIHVARRIAERLDDPTQFHCAEIEEFEASHAGSFDVVYASRGVVRWLPDLNQWFSHVARLLKPGGLFHLNDTHPILKTLREDALEPTPTYAYFSTSSPSRIPVPRAGSNGQAAKYLWTHDLGAIVTAAAGAGLTVSRLCEYPWTERELPFLQRGVPAYRWRLKNGELPLHFSFKAVRPRYETASA